MQSHFTALSPRSLLPWCAAALAALGCPAQADLPAPPPAPTAAAQPWKLGAFFWHQSPNDLEALVGIRRALDLWGHPYELEVAHAQENAERAATILEQFRQRQPDLVFAMGTDAALRCREMLAPVPVVYTAVTHPVESGLVPTWEGSGTNLCGNSNWLGSRRVLAVFHLAVPQLRRLGVLRSRSAGAVSGVEVAGMRRHLALPDSASVELVEELVDRKEDLAAATARWVAADVDALWIPIDFLVYENMDRVLEVARPARLPLVSSSLRGIRRGAVAGVVVDYQLLGQRSVLLALQVLVHGRDPGTLPVGTMQSYRVVVDLGAARALGYRPPLSLLVLADQLIDDGAEVGDGK